MTTPTLETGTPESLLDNHIEPFLKHLRADGYAERTLRKKRTVARAFARWTRRKRIDVNDLNDGQIAAFVARSPRRRKAHVKFELAVMGLFFGYLRGYVGLQRPASQDKTSAADGLLQRYENYLRKDRGLTENSVLVYGPFIRNFLAAQTTQKDSVSPESLDALIIRNFILEHTLDRSSEHTRLLCTALRSFFRFLVLYGHTRRDLSNSVPMVRRHRQVAVPAFLSTEEVERVLTAPDRSKLSRRRDHAILLLLARLGLRAGEVVSLELDDIRWRAGEIVVRGKGRMVDHLPLLSDIGEALALYLREDRGVSGSRRVFLRIWAPRMGLTGPAAVGHIVRRALAQAGVRSDQNGSPRRLHGRDLGSPSASLADNDRDLRTRVLRGITGGCPTVADYRRSLMSALRDALTQYVALRRALGTQLHEPARTLGYFVEFLEREGSEFITSELALRWAMEPKLVQRATWARRLSMVRRFASWLSTVDPRTEVPPRRLLAVRRRRNKPRIFTEQEIVRLMNEAARLSSRTGLRAITYVTLIGLLGATGLRPGEALALDIGDVDLQSGILAVRETKFGKSRFVPVEDSTRAALARYAKQRDALRSRRASEAFLVSERGKRVDSCTARRTFAKMSCAIGLRVPTGSRRIGRGPRLQDFRHSFTTRRLIEWYRTGLDVERELPKLATYLGHLDVSHTYWYIEAVPELLQLATERLEGRKPRGER